MKIVVFISITEALVIENRIGNGIRSTISMSNTIKIMANRKNRIENGTRALWLGSNPHSNGEDFFTVSSWSYRTNSGDSKYNYW